MGTTTDEWEQQTLMPPDVVRVTLTIGIVNSADHLQWQIEAHDETARQQLAMVSMPHAPLGRLLSELSTACARLNAYVVTGSWTV